MTLLGEAGRSGTNAYRGFRFLKRTVHQRALLADIRYRAVVEALRPGRRRDEPVPSHIAQAAKLLCDELDHTGIPGERSRGIIRGTRRMAREGITHGIRFPEWRGGTHTTFFYRLSQWGCSASGTDKGSEALDMAEVERRPDRATRFGNQFSTAVFGLLLDSRGPSEGEEALRAEIANEIMHGMSDEVRQAHYRLLQDSVNSVATGIATWATSYLGFGQTLESSLQFSGTTFALAAGVTAVRHVSLRFLNQRQQEARRQAGYWLNSLHAWMIGYVVWGQGAVRSGAYRGIDQVAYVADALVSKRARIPEGLPPDERIENDIQLLIDNAARVEDGDLEAALMRVQGVLRWGSEHLGSAIGNLVAVIQSVPGILDDAHSPLTLNEGETEPLRLPGSRAGQVSHFTTRPEA